MKVLQCLFCKKKIGTKRGLTPGPIQLTFAGKAGFAEARWDNTLRNPNML